MAKEYPNARAALRQARADVADRPHSFGREYRIADGRELFVRNTATGPNTWLPEAYQWRWEEGPYNARGTWRALKVRR